MTTKTTEEYTDVSRVVVRPIGKATAKKIIEGNHYSHLWSHCSFPFGVYYKSGDAHKWFDETEELIGAATYGHPIGRDVIHSLCTDDCELTLNYSNVLELTRLWIADGYGKNIESYVISQTIQWIKHNAPQYKVLVSYSDPEYGHSGTIYQATNWMYQGNHNNGTHAEMFLSLKENPYEWVHPRTISTRHGSAKIDNLVKIYGTPFWRKSIAIKHRYLYFIGNKRERHEFLRTLKHPILPYPKGASYQPIIERIDLVNDQIVITPISP